MVTAAVRMAGDIGVATNRQDLLARARGLPGLSVHGNRIRVRPEAIWEVLSLNRAAPSPRPTQPTIDISSRADLFADHHTRELRPLSRADVVASARLISALADRCVLGTTCGVPHDAILPLQPIEQYLIGLRHSPQGGATALAPAKEAARYLTEIREIAEPDFHLARRRVSIWVPSPMRLEGNELDDLLDSGIEPLSFYVGSMPLMGLTGPVDPIGVYTLALAETLAGAAILHGLYPAARATIYPHPEPMDPHTGLMAVGTPQWARLELMQKQIMEYLQLEPHRMDVLTSASMPDAQAQMDKASSVSFGVMHGYTRFGMFPLCAGDAYSHAQVILDVGAVHTAWALCRPSEDAQRAEAAVGSVAEALRENVLVGSVQDTVQHLHENYPRPAFRRQHSSAQWYGAGRPDPLADAEAYALELIACAHHAPDGDRFQRAMEVYRRACRAFSVEPMDLE